MPTFYDKLLQVPLLNLSVKAIDRAARSRWLRVFDPAALGRSLAALAAQRGVHVDLGGRVCGYERRPRSGRQSSWPVAAVLEASLHGWPTIRLPLPCRFEFELLRSGIGLGVQRSRSPRYRPLAIGRRSSQARSRRRRGTSQPRLRARIFGGLPESYHANQRGRPVRERAAGSQ